MISVNGDNNKKRVSGRDPFFYIIKSCFDFSRKDAESVHVQQTAVSVGPAVGATMTYLSDAESVAQLILGHSFRVLSMTTTCTEGQNDPRLGNGDAFSVITKTILLNQNNFLI